MLGSSPSQRGPDVTDQAGQQVRRCRTRQDVPSGSGRHAVPELHRLSVMSPAGTKVRRRSIPARRSRSRRNGPTAGCRSPRGAARSPMKDRTKRRPATPPDRTTRGAALAPLRTARIDDSSVRLPTGAQVSRSVCRLHGRSSGPVPSNYPHPPAAAVTGPASRLTIGQGLGGSHRTVRRPPTGSLPHRWAAPVRSVGIDASVMVRLHVQGPSAAVLLPLRHGLSPGRRSVSGGRPLARRWPAVAAPTNRIISPPTTDSHKPTKNPTINSNRPTARRPLAQSGP